MDIVALNEFSKKYKKLKNHNISTNNINDILDNLNEYIDLLIMNKTENESNIEKDIYICNKLQETMCIASILFGIEYDLNYKK